MKNRVGILQLSKNSGRLGIILFLATVFSLAVLGAPTSASASKAAYTVLKDVTYCTTDGVKLLADVYTPVNAPSSNSLVIFVHGGGWTSGDKQMIASSGHLMLTGLNALIAQGFVVASVNYRLVTPNTPFPDAIIDVKCAIRFFRANASTYKVDSNHIGIWGNSAGGHLAGLAAYVGPSQGWDVGQLSSTSSAVTAFVDWYGLPDLYLDYSDARNGATFQGHVLGADPHEAAVISTVFRGTSPSALAPYSPTSYVSGNSPPTLIQQGVLDTKSYPDTSQELAQKLTNAGVIATLTLVQNAGHGFVQVGRNPISPSLTQLATNMVAFFKAHI